ncbi:MAG: ADOP family duplicated permease [Longimicrobiales bacterium]
MSETPSQRRYLRFLTNDPGAEVEDELAFHLARRVEDLMRRGVPEPEALEQARREFGDVDRIRRDLKRIGRGRQRRQARARIWESLVHDVRFAVRSLRKGPAVAAVATATLAVGIGTSAMIYDATRALVTHTVPFPEPDRLVTVDVLGERGRRFNPTYGEFQAWESNIDRLLTLGAYASDESFFGDGSRTFRTFGGRVTSRFFSALSMDPLFGRTISSDDVAPGSDPVVVITQRLWEGRLGADPDIIGKPLRIEGRLHTVIGVVRGGHQYPAGADFWIPLVPTAEEAASLRVSVIGRLGADATDQEAQAALTSIRYRLAPEPPAEDRDTRVAVLSLTGAPEGDRTGLIVIQISVLILLLIMSTNASGLLFTRAIERGQEVAVRRSLGATRGRIVRQLLVESVLLGGVAGVLGVLVGYVAIAMLRSAVPVSMSRHMLGWERFGLDAYIVGFAFALAVLSAIAAGIVPAVRAMRGDLTVHLREGAPTGTRGRRGSLITRLLLSGEVALALTLLLVAGLLMRSLIGLSTTDPGFEAEGVLGVEWALPPERYEEPEAVTRFQALLLERLDGLPGVRSAGLVSNLPMSRTGWLRPYRVQGYDPDSEARAASWRPSTPAYLSTLGIAVLKGRPFARTDGVGAPRVAVISEALANRHWRGADPLGQELEVEGEAWTVIGIAQDVHNFGVARTAEPTIYVPQAQSPSRTGFLAVRVAGNPDDLGQRVRREIWSVDPDVALMDVRTLPQMVQDFYADERLMASLMAAFATIALLITVVSLYAVVAHSVVRRRREIGIRLTLGARPNQILIGAMSHVLVWVGLGIVVGLAMATGAAQLLAATLYGIGPVDVLIFALVPSALCAIALLACYLPARKTTGVDPVETLRCG